MNALALRGDEGRDKLRKTEGIGKYELIRRYPNGATHPDLSGYSSLLEGKRGELKHLSTHRKIKQ